MGIESPVIILPLNPTHEDEVHDIWQTRIGTKTSRISKWLTHVFGDETATNGFVAIHNDRVVGFTITTYGTQEYVNRYIGHEDMKIDEVASTNTLGVCETTAVKQAYEGQGIGTTLLKYALTYLYSENVTETVGMSWNRRNQTDGRVLFEKTGFEKIFNHPSFYAEIDEDIPCLDCPNKCTCGATLFYRQITTRQIPREQLTVQKNI